VLSRQRAERLAVRRSWYCSGVAPPFSWSVSRHTAFAACRRRYYYSYYAASENPEIKRLKNLSALPLWAGSVVHETIENVLKSHDGPPSLEAQEAVVHQAVHGRMVSDWRESEAGSLRFRLFEHEYDVPVEQEDKQIAVGTVRRSLRHFFESATLADALEAGRDRWLSIEDLVSFRVDDVEVLLRMDLAFRRPNGRAVIVDWKTGRSESRFGAVQVAGYALFAADRGWVERPEEIETQLVYLATPRTVSEIVSEATLDRARAFIRRSASDMRALLRDPAANVAHEADFPRVDQPQVCRRCCYRRLCFPRGEAQGPAS
jgi:CRISPR/Cas system-associated exonuclease Cas4 (RecB family)